MTLLEFQQKFGTEEACAQHLEQARWGKDGENRFCPHCGSIKTYKFTSGKLFKCSDCRKQFSVKVGTMFTDSHVPLYKWYLALYLSFSLKKGISSIQLSKYLGVTQGTAWFMLQRIRNTIIDSGNAQLLGDVQIDETYIGGRHHDNKRGRGATGKTPVVGMVVPKGQLRMQATTDTRARTIKPLIRKNVQIGSRVMTDEYRSYNGLQKDGYNHQKVNHSAKEWVNEMATTNAIEGVWKHLKAGIDAIYIHVSPKHLQLYCNEYQYRYNTRDMDDFARFEAWFGLCTGNLRYKELVNG